MTQYIIQDGQGKALQSLPSISSYAIVARNMLSLNPRMPLSVWLLDTISGVRSYDGARTARLSAAIVLKRKEMQK